MKNTDADSKTHQETADVGEVVKAGEEAEDEGDHDVKEDEAEISLGGGTLSPRVEELKEHEGDDAKEGPGGTSGGDS